MNHHELKLLSDALYYQLNERISFIKPKEKIVAQLLFDLGNIAFLPEKYNDALKDYNLAKKYGFTNQLIEQRIKEARQLSRLPKKLSKTLIKNKIQSNYLIYGLWSLGMVLLIIISTLIHMLKKKKEQLTLFLILKRNDQV